MDHTTTLASDCPILAPDMNEHSYPHGGDQLAERCTRL